MKPLSFALSLVLLLLAGCSKPETPLQTKTYPMGKLGNLVLQFPLDWQQALIQVQEGTTNAIMTMDAIQFGPTNGSNFALLIELIPVGEQRAAAFDVKTQLRLNGQGELSNTVETSLNLQEFKGSNTAGAWFHITDRRWVSTNPPPGEFKFLTQSYARLGPLILSCRLVANDPAIEPLALDVLKSARIDKP
jgi:hypothetical protein